MAIEMENAEKTIIIIASVALVIDIYLLIRLTGFRLWSKMNDSAVFSANNAWEGEEKEQKRQEGEKKQILYSVQQLTSGGQIFTSEQTGADLTEPCSAPRIAHIKRSRTG